MHLRSAFTIISRELLSKKNKKNSYKVILFNFELHRQLAILIRNKQKGDAFQTGERQEWG